MFFIPTIFIDRNDFSGVETAVRPASKDLVVHMKALEGRKETCPVRADSSYIPPKHQWRWSQNQTKPT